MSDPARNWEPEGSLERARPDLNAFPPGFKRNPSAWDQRAAVAILAAVGFAISCYLAFYQWGILSSVWDPVFGSGTATVLESSASKRMHRWFGIPDAALGAIAYLGDAILGMAGSTRRWQYRPWMVMLFGLDVIPLGIVSAILVFLQGTTVGAWCFLCLVTAVISLVLVVLAYDEVWACLKYLRRVWRATHDRRVMWNVFWGRYEEAADRVALQEEP